MVIQRNINQLGSVRLLQEFCVKVRACNKASGRTRPIIGRYFSELTLFTVVVDAECRNTAAGRGLNRNRLWYS